jgi:hypothetical protein
MLAASKAVQGLISFPTHALLILEERLAEQEAQGVDAGRDGAGRAGAADPH